MGRYNFDYVIIGSGPAGSAAAINLAKAKKSVAIVEQRFYGGSNLSTRDIPYAVALDFAHYYAKISAYPELKNQNLSFSLPTLVNRELRTAIASGGGSKKPFESAGIICLKGPAHLLDNHTVAVGKKQFTAANFILATGSQPKTSNIAGLDLVPYLTPETAIKVTRLPKVVFIIGGGSTGCEIASFYAELGVKVILAEASSRLLPREDKEVGDTIADLLSHRYGVTVLPSSRVVALEPSKSNINVIFQTGRSQKMVRVGSVVLAAGSEPVLDYGLDNAKVKYTAAGITVNRYFETFAKNIYAIGDCIGGESSTERADYEGTILASALLGKAKAPVNYQGFTRITDTPLQVAVVGLTEDDLLRRDRKYKKALVKLTELPIGKVHDLSYGFIKILADRTDHILGACVVAPHANLLTEEIALAMRHQLTALEIASTPHVMNSLSYAVRLAARAIVTNKK